MIKQDIVTNYKSSNYSISSLKYRLLGFNITASDIRIHVNPSKIDTVKTKINFPLIFARNVTVNNGLINLRYYEINLGSIYGIYDKITDKMTMHIPIRIALQYIPHNTQVKMTHPRQRVINNKMEPLSMIVESSLGT